ncbi:MAG TPA: pitrilysin family protein [Gemmatimonadales bacterium]|nr:pitrilysin family protein [Gemmatimonadales bacterium]
MPRLSGVLTAATALALVGGPVAAPAPLRAQARPAQARSAAAPARAAVPDIPYTHFVLPNGLTLLVHEDHKAPIVAFNIWYHVGSGMEPQGKSGFAHLFEHLMFNGSEHYDDDYFKAIEPVGATDLNGTTNTDRTNYFENVPTPALDRVLFLESDRMGWLLGAVDTAKLNEQRGVVQNEKRQGENQPYGRVWENIATHTYPVGHPYHHTTIGSMEDLNAASLDDVREWFRNYYGPNNAVVVIAGDITPAAAKQKVEHWFGNIPPVPPIARPARNVAKMTTPSRGWMQDRVPQARVYKVWNVPGFGTAEADHLTLAADVLASGKNSWLYKRLVYDDQIATDVVAFMDANEFGGQFYVWATAKPGGDLAAVERAVNEEVARFRRTGPTASELSRAQADERAGFLRGIERIGGFGGKSDVLASNFTYTGDPAHYKVSQQRLATATPAQVAAAARTWLDDGVYTLEVHPYPDVAAATADSANRSQLPGPGQPPAPKFPDFATDTLANGLRVLVATRPGVPLVNLELLVDAGYAADQGGIPGTASLTASMLDEGTTTRSALAISDQLQRLGATLGSGANVDMNVVSMSLLKERMDSSLALFADVVLHPSFPAADFKRLQQQQLARIQREKVTPVQIALRVMPELLYGAGHAYAQPLTGSGTEASVQRLTPAALAQFHRTWFKPNHATLVVVGATTLQELKPKLERAFAGWAPGPVPAKNIATVPPKGGHQVYLIDRPGSQQSIIFAGELAPPKRNPQEIAIGALNDIMGGSFTSRINMNLREAKHWSYGAFTILFDARGQRPFVVYAPVQTDKTKESIAEVVQELKGIVADRPVTAEELARAQADLTLTLPGQWETNAAVAGSLGEIVRFGLPHDYFDKYATAVRALQLADLRSVAGTLVHPDRTVWVIVGDRAKIEPGVKEVLGDVQLLDADGRPAGGKPKETSLQPARP